MRRVDGNASCTAVSTSARRCRSTGTRSVPVLAAISSRATSAASRSRRPMPAAKAMRKARRKLAVRTRPNWSRCGPARCTATVACTSNDVNSSSTAARSSGYPKVWATRSRSDQIVRHPLADATDCRSCTFGRRVRRLDHDADARGPRPRPGVAAVEHGLLDGVPGHELLRLGGERLRLRGELGGLRLGEQAVHLLEDARGVGWCGSCARFP